MADLLVDFPDVRKISSERVTICSRSFTLILSILNICIAIDCFDTIFLHNFRNYILGSSANN